MNKAVDKLESVKASFEHWRKTRARQGKIPDHLWSQVKELLGSYSLTKICTTLKVSHVQIKENISEVSNEFRFVEVGSPTISNPFNGTVFAFSNRTRTSVKLLVYDASVFWLCQKCASTTPTMAPYSVL
jgi:hypothetical protein